MFYIKFFTALVICLILLASAFTVTSLINNGTPFAWFDGDGLKALISGAGIGAFLIAYKETRS